MDFAGGFCCSRGGDEAKIILLATPYFPSTLYLLGDSIIFTTLAGVGPAASFQATTVPSA